MNGYPLGDGAQRALQRAREEAVRLGHEVVGAEVLLMGLFLTSPSAEAACRALGMRPEELVARLEAGQKRIRSRSEHPDGLLPLSSHARRLLDSAAREATERGASVSDEHLVVAALVEPRGTFARVLSEQGITPDQARQAAVTATGLMILPRTEAPRRAEAPEAPKEMDVDEELAAARARRDEARKARREAERQRHEERRAKAKERNAERAARADRDAPSPRNESGRGREGGRAREEFRSARSSTSDRRDEGDRPEPRPPSVGKLAPKPKQPIWRFILLPALPASIAAYYLHQPPALVFVLACLGVLPLAGFMGEATEHLSARSGPTIGGLLNATFGNAAELIIAIAALRAGLLELVKASITGSILGNLLLIMGLSLLAGGWNRSELRFNRSATGMSGTMLTVAVASLVLPALFHATHRGDLAQRELMLSEGVAIVLLLSYACSLLFSLKTHKRLFGGEPHPTMGTSWSVGFACLVLGLATVGVAIEAEILVHATQALTAGSVVPQFFLGLIVIPLIGNAAEHAAAIVVARKGQTDLALQIALGSSTQIALLVAPLLVFVGVLLGQPMNLVFSIFEVMALALATVIATQITLDGESHWYEGVQLLAMYALLAIAAWFV